MEDVVIVAAARTAVGKFGGALAKVAAPDLGATVIKAWLEQLDFRGLQVASPGWERDISVQGIDLKYLHDFAARPSTSDGPLS